MAGVARKDEELAEYNRKRSFEKTPEPTGRKPPEQEQHATRFVVQEHHARRLHWDLRLERDGVLASWALPRGFPETTSENRLAIHTEDHPLEYLTFAGDIPAGEYGGGGMFIWDSGTYEAEKFTATKVTFELSGDKVQGKFALFQTHDDQWLLHRMTPVETAREPMPLDVEPMTAVSSRTFPSDEAEWGFEISWSGVRTIAYGEVGRLTLMADGEREVTRQFPELAPLVRALGSHRAVLDGVIVAFDESGRPTREPVERRIAADTDSLVRRLRRDAPVTYVLFDALYADRRNLVEAPYEERRAELDALRLSGPNWQVPAYQPSDGLALLEASREQGLDGIVAKRLASPYRPGQRSRDWRELR
jgi:bifunctional non-homologous end joining protein LigD